MTALLCFFLLIQDQTLNLFGIQISVNPNHTEWAKSDNKSDFLENQFELVAEELVSAAENNLSLTDWQKIKLASLYSGALFPEEMNKSSQLTWSLWKKWGFDTAWVKTDSGLRVPLIAFSQQLYGLQFYRIAGKKFYDVLKLTQSEKSSRKIKITLEDIEQNQENGLKPVVIDLSRLPVVGESKSEKKLTWEYRGKNYEVTAEINRNLAEYYSSLPNIRFQDALLYRFSPGLMRSFIIPLKAMMKENELTEHEKVECIRQLLLQCFPYIDDQVLFGFEHLQFPDEILLSDGCDCEDRSVFMFKLVEELTTLKPLLADFPQHVSLLVTAPEDWKGEVYEFGSRYYLYCDPTYFNAPFGETPAEIKELIPEIIDYDEKF